MNDVFSQLLASLSVDMVVRRYVEMIGSAMLATLDEKPTEAEFDDIPKRARAELLRIVDSIGSDGEDMDLPRKRKLSYEVHRYCMELIGSKL